MRSANALLISLVACSAPSTVIEFDGLQGKRRRHIGRNAGQADHLDVQLFTSRFDRLQIRAGEMAETELQRMPHDRLLDFLRMGRKPVADRGPDEVGAVRIKALLHKQIDVAEVDVTEIDRDLFRFARSVAEPMNFGGHHVLHHLYGWYMDGTFSGSRAEVP